MVSVHAARPERAREAHTLLREGNLPSGGLIPALIESSWHRCCASGLDVEGPQDYSPLRRDVLGEHLEKSHHLVSHATPVMETLYHQIAGTQSMVVLTDAHGLILHSLGDAEFLERAQRVALAPGVSWAEEAKGTNAIGTALVESAPVCVNGPEHFLTANHFLTCSASPIMDPYGKSVGVLDVTGDYRGYSAHTIALVNMSVQMIENHLFSAAFPEAISIHFHSRPEFLGTLCEGIVSFTPDGDFISANRSACFQLGRKLAELRAHSFGSLFGQPLQSLLDQAVMQPDVVANLCLHTGIRVQARLRFGSRARRPVKVFAFDAPSSRRPLTRPRAEERRPASALENLMTGDPQIELVCTKVRKVLGRDITILIQGETGTGKELLANAIHTDSPRREHPFVAVNCASIPDTLIESELFGYEEGAFTGAKRKGNAGKILQADGGTLFLDEIGDMPLNLQARLLRVLQERRVTPLGSIKSYPVDISVICATNRRLRDMVAQGEFREDLYYRLNGLTVNLPALRNRTDVERIIHRILEREAGEREVPHIDSRVMDLFLNHPWPGNLRQLTHLLRTALVMCEDDQAIRIEHLPDDFLDEYPPREPASRPAPAAAAPSPAVPALPGRFTERLEHLELQAIQDALEKHRGNVSAASRQLGISRNTIYRKLKML